MGYGSIVSIFDRLSIKTVLTNYTGSYIGFAGTLAFIAVCLILLIPPVNQYFTGAYFESQFQSDQQPKSIYNTGDDVILAMVFKNRITGELANHSAILQNLNSYGYYYGGANTYKIDLAPCQTQVFKKAINPMKIQDCIMMPFGLQYDSTPAQNYLPTLQMFFSMKCDDIFKCSDNSPFKKIVAQFITDLAKDYYYQYIFNSKIIDEKGRLTNQFHKIYSTQFESPDGFVNIMNIIMQQKKYFVDDSILPWWNNLTYQNVYWAGDVQGMDMPQAFAVSIGFFSDYFIDVGYRYAYRYYKKLDYLLGMIGGTVFLLFLIFWVPFSYINRTLQKIKNAQQLLLDKDQLITTQQNLHKIDIPFYYIFTKFLPGNKTNDIIQESESQIDIAKLIKKMKVTHRNLRVKQYDLSFKSKDIDLQSGEPEQFLPDRHAIQHLQISRDALQALTKSKNTTKIYQNNAPVLSLIPDSNLKIDQVMQDEIYNKNRSTQKKFFSCKGRIKYILAETIKFFDIFGARPMLNAEPQTSSCWGFLLTLVIIVLSILTFALTMQNFNNIKLITSYRYEKPLGHSYEMTTGKTLRFAFCFDSAAANKFLTGTTKTAQLTFFRYSKKTGYETLAYEKMVAGQFADYFDLAYDNPYVSAPSQYCFKPSDNQKVVMSGSFETINQAYFGARLDPYCSGTASQCKARSNQTIADFVNFVNYRSYGIFLSQNKYSPDKGKIISGIAGLSVSQSDNVLNASLLRTQTIYTSQIQLLDDTSKQFLRKDPKIITQAMIFSNYGDRNAQRKGDTSSAPGYILNFRPNGQVESVILRTYKIDFLLGIIGGVFLFWYFFIHFFAKIYNAYKVRSKLAQTIHQQDGYDESILVHFLYLTRFPKSLLLCCLQIKEDVQRVELVDKKMQRDLNYLTLVKNIDNCYRLSSSLFNNLIEKDLSLIYFRQKIDEAQLVKPKRIAEVQNNQFEDDQFLQFDDDNGLAGIEANNSMNVTSNLLPEQSMAINNLDLEKIINAGKSVETVPLYDPMIPHKKQHKFTEVLKYLDAFKNPPQLTLDGQRDVKSIFGGIMFFGVVIVIIIAVVHFLTIYTQGTDYTVSHRRIVDGDLNYVDSKSTLGDLNPGISFVSGKNFKFLVSFNKKDQYFPLNVSQFIGPIGIRMLQYTITKKNGQINQTYESIQFQPCRDNYLNSFLGPYNDPQAFQMITLGYCLPDGKTLQLKGLPQDQVTKYFKFSVYNKYNNATGRSYLNSFFKVYLVQYYLSVPRMDIFQPSFSYQMIKFNTFTDPYAVPIEENLTFTKVIFTDKYYSRSRETYNDRSSRSNDRLDLNLLSNDSTRNMSFYYTGMLDHYTLDYPGGGELFGLVGGVIALFVFFVYSCISSYNQYRMKYLIGQRLYTFDKKLSGLTKQKKRKLNMKKLQQATKQVNNFNEFHILVAWILNPIGYARDNYNFNKILRRITLLIDRVQNDINLFNVYKNLFTYKSIIDKKVKLLPEDNDTKINLSSVYIKHIYQKEKIETDIPIIAKQSKKHKLSSFEDFKISKAIDAKVNPQTVLGDKVLNRAFGLDEGTSVLASRMRMHQDQDESSIHNNDIPAINQEVVDRIRGSQQFFRQRQEQTVAGSQNIQAFQIEENQI